MAPRRSFRRQSANTAYKKGDTVEFNLNGTNVKGKLVKKSPRGSATSPIWIVAPSDRRRKSEEVPEKALGRLILDDGASSSVKSKRISRSYSRDTASSYSEESLEEHVSHANSPASSGIRRKSTQGSGSRSSEESSKLNKKRKSVESNGTNANSRKSRKVTFQDSTRPSSGVVLAPQTKEKKVTHRKPVRVPGVGAIGTRSTRTNGKLLSELPRTKNTKKAMKPTTTRKVKNDEDVKVIKMLTGTLYLYRGETRRAEFVRSKY
eukprot:CCRYP_003752-RA/>CCRYP_003752-RA protein AED:0.08 eAED:0.08 QI:308/1/1/1/1/1/2/385/262